MVSLVVSNTAGLSNGKAPPSDLGLAKNKLSSSNGNGNGVVKGAGNGGVGGGTAPRKLTKNEKRRQKNKQRKAQALEGAVADKPRVESNGVAVASWPPPSAAKDDGGDVQVCVCVCFWCCVSGFAWVLGLCASPCFMDTCADEPPPTPPLSNPLLPAQPTHSASFSHLDLASSVQAESSFLATASCVS